MKEKRLSFAERYPNYRREIRNECITNMVAATGWWRVNIDSDNNIWIEPIAFFAKLSYEERGVWDHGQTKWETTEIVFANSGRGEEWALEPIYAESQSYTNSRLFYDPDFRLSRDDQDAGEKWLNEKMNK